MDRPGLVVWKVVLSERLLASTGITGFMGLEEA